MTYKFCAFGSLYKDMRGIIEHISEDGNIVWIGHNDKFELVTPWDKNFVKIFETIEDRNKWINDQNYQYDSRS